MNPVRVSGGGRGTPRAFYVGLSLGFWRRVAMLPAATARIGYLLGAWSFEMLFAAAVGDVKPIFRTAPYEPSQRP